MYETAPSLNIIFKMKFSVSLQYIFVIIVKLNGGRIVSGVLRGFDPYMNIVIDDAMEERSNTEKVNIGMVVRFIYFY